MRSGSWRRLVGTRRACELIVLAHSRLVAKTVLDVNGAPTRISSRRASSASSPPSRGSGRYDNQVLDLRHLLDPLLHPARAGGDQLGGEGSPSAFARPRGSARRRSASPSATAERRRTSRSPANWLKAKRLPPTPRVARLARCGRRRGDAGDASQRLTASPIERYSNTSRICGSKPRWRVAAQRAERDSSSLNRPRRPRRSRVGARLGISAEAVRQTERRALRRLSRFL